MTETKDITKEQFMVSGELLKAVVQTLGQMPYLQVAGVMNQLIALTPLECRDHREAEDPFEDSAA